MSTCQEEEAGTENPVPDTSSDEASSISESSTTEEDGMENVLGVSVD